MQTEHELRIASLQSRLDRIDKKINRLIQIETRYPWYRLGTFVTFMIGSYLAFTLFHHPVEWLVSFILFAAFVITTILHRKIISAINRYHVFAHLTRRQIARATLDWEGIPENTPISVTQHHPFNQDLNITGRLSLHQLIDSTSSTGASQRLADWLLTIKPDLSLIKQRQSQVQELLKLQGLRTRFTFNCALVAADLSNDPAIFSRWDSQTIFNWLKTTDSLTSMKYFLVGLVLLALVNVVLLLLFLTGFLQSWWTISLFIYLALQAYLFRRIGNVFNEAHLISRTLVNLSGIFNTFENYNFQAKSELISLTNSFNNVSEKPSKILRQAGIIASAASLHHNPLLSLLLNLLVPWDLFFAYQLERLKQRLLNQIPHWLDSLHTFEALCALAEFSFLNPGYSFPELSIHSQEKVFSTKNISHPLISEKERVCNSFEIDRLGSIYLITGSNMSGKSTFLRTIGINLCLAYAGSVVCAESMQTNMFRLFTSMNVSDSLNEGISFFYAEVRRLKSLLEFLQKEDDLPLFYLIDEIFRGTNNRERRIGSEAYLRALASKNGTGVISTHDLDLTRLEKDLPNLYNYHFREEVVGELMVFDYKLHPGPSPTTNALRIMIQAGLPVNLTYLEE